MTQKELDELSILTQRYIHGRATAKEIERYYRLIRKRDSYKVTKRRRVAVSA